MDQSLENNRFENPVPEGKLGIKFPERDRLFETGNSWNYRREIWFQRLYTTATSMQSEFVVSG